MDKYADCDFSGWATRNDVLCSDGRTIRKGAFSHQDGQKVPLIWAHQHDSPESVLGHGFLEERPEGVYFYGYLNDTPLGQYSKKCIKHGDITSLSIWANQLQQNAGSVIHGDIKEVSLVLAGANRKAVIEFPTLAHGDDIEENMTEAYMWMGDDYALEHSGLDKEPKDDDKPQPAEEKPDEKPAEKPDEKEGTEKVEEKKEQSVGDALKSLNEDQKVAVSVLIAGLMKNAGKVPADKDDDDEEKKPDDSDDKSDEDEKIKHSDMEDDDMQYNAFDTQTDAPGYVLSHSDEEMILANAKKSGSFKKALDEFADENSLSHDGLKGVSGFGSYPADANTPAGVDALFPEWHDVRPGAPELVTNDMDWVKAVLGQVNRSPYSRIRTRQVDLRGIEELRAKGYLKGKEKTLAGQYNVAKRETSPQTVYVKSALNNDDIIDIDYQYKIDRMELERELAQAVLIGDGRDAASADKIDENRIRNIWKDDDIFTIHKVLKLDANANGTNTAANFGNSFRYAEAMEELLLDAKIDYRGSGAMNMFCQQAFYNKMMLARDLNGRRMYNTKAELASALDVNNVYNVPEFENKTRTVTVDGVEKTYRLLAIIGNLKDYSMGATKGGEIVHRTQFDIDFNQQKSLIETRVSGATTRLYSFIVIEEEVTAGGPNANARP